MLKSKRFRLKSHQGIFPDDDLLVENVQILTFYQTFSLLLILHHIIIDILERGETILSKIQLL